MLDVIGSEPDRKLLAKWFKRDDNLIPAKYVLQPVREVIPNYNNREVSPEERSTASQEWWAAFEKMQSILRKASSDALSDKEEISKYHISGKRLMIIV